MVQNLHTHTVFCDGKNTAEEMVLSAINKGLKSLGFSGHSKIPVENDWCIQDLNAYIDEILRLRAKYCDKIEIFLGLETECIYPIDRKIFDYTISSVHTICKNSVTFDVDLSRETMISDVNTHYNGDFFAYIADYYDLVIKASQKGDILGHFDLVTKFNKNNDLFDENSAKYRDIAENTLLKCIKNDIIFEINTGAIERGYRKDFYPAPYLLNKLLENNAKIIVTSDAHSSSGIDFYYNESIEILKQYGFKTQMILTKNGFIQTNL